jgi:phosphoglucosamine mutase
MAALQVLAVMRETGQSLAELAAGMPRFPQTMINVKVAKRFDPKTVPEVQTAVTKVSERLGADGRVVLRPSGTEPVIRVMVEAREETDTVRCAEEIAAVVRRVAS